jgi:hypothetical protein
LGGVKDKYLFHKNARVQHVGRCALGLNADTAEFAVCRAHFDFSSLATQEEKIEREKMIKKWLSDRLPNDVTEHTYNLAIRCFAAICYHYKDLNEKLHKKCILQNSPVFKDIPDSFLDVAVIAYPWTKTKYTPKLRDTPLHVTQLYKMNEIKHELATLWHNFMKDINKEMDRRGFASTECNTIKIIAAIASLAARIETMGTVRRTQPRPDEETVQEQLATFVMEDKDYDDSDHMLLEEDQAEEIVAISKEEKQLHIERNHQQTMDHVKKGSLQWAVIMAF